MNRKTTRSVVLMTFITGVLTMSANGYFAWNGVRTQKAVCGSGQFSAVLTGWDLNGSTPKGEASYDSNKNLLSVDVQNVKLKDGTVLDVLIGDDKIGRMEPLKDGSAKATITTKEDLDEKSRVRVFDDDRPIVSANLQCDASETGHR